MGRPEKHRSQLPSALVGLRGAALARGGANGRDAFDYHLMSGNDVDVTSASAIGPRVIAKIDHSIRKTALVQEIQFYAYIAGQNLLAAANHNRHDE